MQNSIQIIDFDANLNSKNCFQFWTAVEGQQTADQNTLPLIDILDMEFNAGNIDDYGKDFAGVGFVVVEPGEDYNYCQATNELNVTAKKRFVYTFQQWAQEFIDDDMLERFVAERQALQI